MKILRAATVLALVTIGVGIGYLSAQGDANAASDGLSAQDYADIQQLYWRYNHGADFRDPELFGSAFAEDALFQPGFESDVNGRTEIISFISRGEKGTDSGSRHWNNSWRITLTAEGAQGRVYWLVLDVGSGNPIAGLPGAVQPTHRSTGYYDDVYVKMADGWRIKKRTLNFDEAE